MRCGRGFGSERIVVRGSQTEAYSSSGPKRAFSIVTVRPDSERILRLCAEDLGHLEILSAGDKFPAGTSKVETSPSSIECARQPRRNPRLRA